MAELWLRLLPFRRFLFEPSNNFHFLVTPFANWLLLLTGKFEEEWLLVLYLVTKITTKLQIVENTKFLVFNLFSHEYYPFLKGSPDFKAIM
jgi:hypothetical protein